MNILVIGNGFDIEHGLPTKYANFLDFIKWIGELSLGTHIGKKEDFEAKLNNEIKGDALDKKVKGFLTSEIFFERKSFNEWINEENSKELIDCSKKNIWVEYFNGKEEYKNKRWVDFETEISKVIQALEYSNELSTYYKNAPKNGATSTASIIRTYEKYDINKDVIFSNIISCIKDKKYVFVNKSVNQISESDLDKIIEILNKDLIQIIRCLEIYLYDYVGKLPCSESKYIENEKYDGVLSFNYTNTFEKLYKLKWMSRTTEKLEEPFDYIHGKADLVKHKKKEENNMVLGIDEYLEGDDKNKKLDFIQFKKYFQRILKKTGNEYRKWIREMNKKPNHHEITIFGHSLDVSDKDILKKLILESAYKDEKGIYQNNTKVIIYYYSEEVYAKQISNLVKIIGQDELIDRVSGENPSIIFKKQN